MGLTDYRVQLATEIVADIEGNRNTDEQVLYKARRLANLVGDSLVEEWLGYELAGYPTPVPARLQPLVNKSGLDFEEGITHTRHVILDSLPRIETSVIPSMDKAWQHNANVKNVIQRRVGVTVTSGKVDPSKWEDGIVRVKQSLIRYSGIQRAVRAEIHRFAAAAHHRFAFTEVASAIFEKHQKTVDALLTGVAPDVVEKIPAIYDRLAAGVQDGEALSQAMASCRRMISSFADAVAPVIDTSGTGSASETQPSLTRQNYLNRIEQFVRDHTSSESRRERLMKTVRLLNERTSAGLKADITADEARDLSALTYLTLGEIASLQKAR